MTSNHSVTGPLRIIQKDREKSPFDSSLGRVEDSSG